MRWVLVAVVGMLLVGLIGRIRIFTHPLEGADAPDFHLPRLEGKPFSLSQETAQVIVLDFWASWCPPCITSLPQLEQVHQWARKHNKSVVIYCVNQGEEPCQISELWQSKGFTMPVLLDMAGNASAAYQVSAIPQTVIISNHKVVRVHVGTVRVSTLQREIEEVLADHQALAETAFEREGEAPPSQNAREGSAGV